MPPPRAPMLLHLEIIASDNGTSLPPREAICNSIFTFQQAPHSCSGFGGGRGSHRQLQGCPAVNPIYFDPSLWAEKAGAPLAAGCVDILLP